MAQMRPTSPARKVAQGMRGSSVLAADARTSGHGRRGVIDIVCDGNRVLWLQRRVRGMRTEVIRILAAAYFNIIEH